MSRNPNNDNIFDTNDDMNFNYNSNITFYGNSSIDDNLYVGFIELFHVHETIPDNYLLCDGSQISSVSNPEYQTLINILTNTNNTKNLAYLPNFINKIPFGWRGSYTYYNSANPNTIGSNILTIDNFPSHSHNHNLNLGVDYSVYYNNIRVNYGRDVVSSITANNANFNIAKSNVSGRTENQTSYHTHNVSVANKTIGFQFNSTINTSIKTNNNLSTNNAGSTDSIELNIESYKLYFAIRFK